MQPFNARQFIREKVRPHLKDMDKYRVRALNLYFFAVVFGVAGGFIVFLNQGQSPEMIGIGMMACFLAVAFFLFGGHAQGKYREQFKRVVMENLIKAAHPTYTYAHDVSIAESVYEGSRIFPKDYDRYTGDDYVSGKIGQTDFCFSELHTEYKTTSTDSKGRTTTQWHTIFQGIFFHADFHKHFAGATFVLPDRAESAFGSWLGQGLQSWMSSHGELVKLEDVAFEKAFVTYSNDQQEARYILSPSMMEKILALRNRFRIDIYLGFLGERVYVALATNKAHFEPSVWQRGISEKEVEEHLGLIAAVSGIVEDLSLNTRIWTKA